MYEMQAQLSRGEAAERQLDAHFADRFAIQTASHEQQRLGIDRIFAKRPATNNSGRIYTIEYKTDWTAGHTGNAFIETVSVDSMSIPGWAYTSQAEWLVYWVPPRAQLYLIRMHTLRRHLDDWIEQHGPAKFIPNDGYYTCGVPVPLDEFEQRCEKIERLAESHVE